MSEITSKIASQALTKAIENTAKETRQISPNQEGSFHQMLQNADQEYGRFMNVMEMGENQLLPKGNIEAISAEGVSLDSGAAGQFDTGSDAGRKVVQMLEDFNHNQVQMDNLMNHVLYSEKRFSNQELLAIQAHVFHLAQMTELTVKSVELAVSSFKGVMNTQIQ